jgi:hypothetical protein
MRRAVLQLQHMYHSSYAACRASTAAGSCRYSSSAGVVDQMLQYVNTDLHVSARAGPRGVGVGGCIGVCVGGGGGRQRGLFVGHRCAPEGERQHCRLS